MGRQKKDEAILAEAKVMRIPTHLEPVVVALLEAFRESKKDWINRGRIAGSNEAKRDMNLLLGLRGEANYE